MYNNAHFSLPVTTGFKKNFLIMLKIGNCMWKYGQKGFFSLNPNKVINITKLMQMIFNTWFEYFEYISYIPMV